MFDEQVPVDIDPTKIINMGIRGRSKTKREKQQDMKCTKRREPRNKYLLNMVLLSCKPFMYANICDWDSKPYDGLGGIGNARITHRLPPPPKSLLLLAILPRSA